MAVAATDESNWAWLPKHLLDSILDKLVHLSDYVRFSAVCRPWHSVADDEKKKHMEFFKKQPPMLLIPTADKSEVQRSLFIATDGKLCDFQLRVPYSRRLCGSSHGWLATVKETTEKLFINLINPFSAQTIRLPSITDNPYYDDKQYEDDDNIDMHDDVEPRCEDHVIKVVLSADPSLFPDYYVVASIYTKCNQLAFIRSGDKSWTYLGEEAPLYSDIIFHKGQLHVVDRYGQVQSINMGRNKPQLETIISTDRRRQKKTYIVESSEGELLMVYRLLEYKDDTVQKVTTEFKVFKLLMHTNELKWVGIESLGDDALFLGDSHSMSIVASNFFGCHSNSIYYTEDCMHFVPCFPFGPIDIGVFNLGNRSFKQHYVSDPSFKTMPPPIWIKPTC